ncbi:hypothetical protein SBOR_2379 [Sclerotinia borealis F-4128]|uniref:Uncharacterized protein n=1 Tax=Sclerotinia borealis (strain F-4128) TaxID=1432307 RepID=W9CN33_SCLBF|nr:hypothetical protein SBOR_2379 [Sclerotinia borealis F-4128]
MNADFGIQIESHSAANLQVPSFTFDRAPFDGGLGGLEIHLAAKSEHDRKHTEINKMDFQSAKCTVLCSKSKSRLRQVITYRNIMWWWWWWWWWICQIQLENQIIPTHMVLLVGAMVTIQFNTKAKVHRLGVYSKKLFLSKGLGPGLSWPNSPHFLHRCSAGHKRSQSLGAGAGAGTMKADLNIFYDAPIYPGYKEANLLRGLDTDLIGGVRRLGYMPGNSIAPPRLLQVRRQQIEAFEEIDRNSSLETMVAVLSWTFLIILTAMPNKDRPDQVLVQDVARPPINVMTAQERGVSAQYLNRRGRRDAQFGRDVDE